MKLRLLDIPAEGFDLTAKSAKDPWYRQVVQEVYGEDFRNGTAVINLHLLKTCDNVSIDGHADLELNPTCDRCLEPFSRQVSVPVEMVLAPWKEPEKLAGDDRELVEEDLNFSFYEGETIDLANIIREFLLLSIPIRYLCQETCKGICPRCGENLNKKDCHCESAQEGTLKSMMPKILLLVFLLVSFFPMVSFGQEEETPQWTTSGEPFNSPAKPRKGFFAAAGPQVSGFVNEIRRPAIGLDLRGGYGLTDQWLVSLNGEWSFTKQFDVIFNFFDFVPHVSYFWMEDAYLFGGVGPSIARSGGGTQVAGFSTRRAETQFSWVGGAGVGYEFITGSGLSLVGEFAGVYRRISSGNFFQPVVRALLVYRF